MKWALSGFGISVFGILVFACAQTGHVGDEVPNGPPPLVGEAGPGDGDVPDTGASTCGDCPAYSFCENGLCRCPVSHSTICGGACVDLQTDDANCGKCGLACALGEDGGTGARCLAGACRAPETFPSGVTGAVALFTDAQSVYVFGRGNRGHALQRAEKSRLDAFTRMVDVPEINVEAVYTAATLAGDDIYMGYHGGVFRYPKAGGALQRISTDATFAFAATSTHLYVAGSQSIFRMTLPDGPLEPFIDFPASHLAVRGDELYAAKNDDYPRIRAQDILRVDLTTKVATVIAATVHVTGLAPVDDGLVWSSGLAFVPPEGFGERRVLRWKRSSNAISVVQQNPYAPVTGVVVDGPILYFTNGYYKKFDQNAHALVTMRPIGESIRVMTLATALEPSTSQWPQHADGRIVVERMRAPLLDGGFVYWLDEVELYGTRVRRIAVQ